MCENYDDSQILLSAITTQRSINDCNETFLL